MTKQKMTEAAAPADHRHADAHALRVHRPADRRVLSVDGPDAQEFLQDLLTNDVALLKDGALTYAALLTPQGKFLADMMVLKLSPTRFLLDLHAGTAADTARRLAAYKLHADIALMPQREGAVIVVWGDQAEAAAPRIPADPRAPGLARRAILTSVAEADALASDLDAMNAEPADAGAWRRRQIEARVPLPVEDLAPNESFPLELGFDRLRGVDFRKGCYVGQEVTARMRHKAVLKKGLARVAIDGPAPEPGADLEIDGRSVGRMGSSEDGVGLALLRLDRVEAGAALTSGEARLTVLEFDTSQPAG